MVLLVVGLVVQPWMLLLRMQHFQHNLPRKFETFELWFAKASDQFFAFLLGPGEGEDLCLDRCCLCRVD